jgi:hypothetical protein
MGLRRAAARPRSASAPARRADKNSGELPASRPNRVEDHCVSDHTETPVLQQRASSISLAEIRALNRFTSTGTAGALAARAPFAIHPTGLYPLTDRRCVPRQIAK